MKRASLLIILLLFLPIAEASVSFDKLNDISYNLGDSLQLSGVSTDYGILNLNLNCGSSSINLGSISVIDNGFSRLMPLVGIEGECNIAGKLTDITGNAVQDISTESFKVSSTLEGKFLLASDNIQLGDSLRITGDVKRLDGTPVDGIVIFNIKKDGVVYLVESSEVKKGDVSYSTSLILLPAGDYTVDVDARDNFGNKLSSKNLLKFKIYNDLSIIPDLDKSVYLPGDILNLKVDIIKNVGGNLTKIFTNVDINGERYNETVSNFGISYNIPKDIKSFNHIITIESKDNVGNIGKITIPYYIEPVPTKIDLNISKEEFNPGEEVSSVVTVFDQADDLLNGEVSLKFYKGDKIISEQNGKINEVLKFSIDKFAEPGERVIHIESLGLNVKKEININTVEAIDASLEGQNLILYNKGNVIYDDDLAVKADGKESRKKLYLSIDRSVTIDLANYFDEGNYSSIIIENTNTELKDIEIKDERSLMTKLGGGLTGITGNAVLDKNGVKPTKLGFYALILVLSVFLSFYTIKLSLKGYKHMKEKDKKLRDFREGRKRMGELQKESSKEAKKNTFDYSRYNKADVEDWKRNVIRSYEETNSMHARETRNNRYVYESQRERSSERKGNGDAGNAFTNMFG